MIESILRAIASIERRLGRLETQERPIRFVPLSTPLTSTSYDGDDTVTVGTVSIDTSTVFGAELAGAKGLMVYVAATWASASNDSYLALRPKGGSVNYLLMRAQTTFGQNVPGYVTCDAAGDIDVVVAGANATNVVLRILGYWL